MARVRYVAVIRFRATISSMNSVEDGYRQGFCYAVEGALSVPCFYQFPSVNRILLQAFNATAFLLRSRRSAFGT